MDSHWLAYLKKPFEPALLLDAIRSLLAQANLHISDHTFGVIPSPSRIGWLHLWPPRRILIRIALLEQTRPRPTTSSLITPSS